MVVKSVTTSGTLRISASIDWLINALRSMDEPGGASATTSNSLMSSSTTNSSLDDLMRNQPPTMMAAMPRKQIARCRRHHASAPSYAPSIL
jgi:hypothetical protein